MARYKGHTGSITIDGDMLVLSRDTFAGQSTFGKGAERQIPLSELSGIEFVDATTFKNGGIKLLFGGASSGPLAKPLASDGDTVLFTAGQKNDFNTLRRYLEDVVAQNHANGADFSQAPQAQVSKLDQRIAVHKAKQAELVAAMPEAPARRPDIEAAAARLGWTFGSKREIANLHTHLMDGEIVEFLAAGTYEDKQGLLALTNYRLLFLFHGLLTSRTEDFPIANVSSIQVKSGFATSELTIHASGNKAVIKGVVGPDAKAIADAMRTKTMLAKAPAPAATASVQAAPDVLEQVKKLGELRDAGVLTDEEFAAKKAALLDRL